MNPERRMSLLDHLVELRKRAVRSVLGILIGAIAGWFVSEALLNALSAPLVEATEAAGLGALNFPTITGAFDVRLQIAIIVGVILSSPIWLYQIFAFLTPAFTRNERKYVYGFFFSAVPLFLAGCAAGWILIPHIVALMISFAPGQATTLIDAKGYLDFALRLMLVVGIGFVLPVFLVLLNFAGVLSGRTILKGWRWAILSVTLFCAIATPAADVISMILLAIPMIALYFGAVGVALVHDRRAARRAAVAA